MARDAGARKELVVVTGATSGIGLEVARRWRARGARVWGTGRDEERLAALSREIDRALFLDVTDEGSVEAFAAAVLDGAGVPDVLVLNAGIGLFRDWRETGADDLARLLDVDLVGVHRVAVALLPAMVERRRGRLVAVASVAGLRGFPRQVAYCAAKHGLVGWCRAMAEELRGSGVEVAWVCPPAVDTPFFERAGWPHFREDNPHVGMLDPGEVAEAVVAARSGEVLVGARARLLAVLDRVAPGLPGRMREVALSVLPRRRSR